MKAFVTGGTGFVGGNLVYELVRQGFSVRALVRKGSQLANLHGLPIEIAEGDLLDARFLSKAMEGIPWVFHVAAHYSLARRDREAIYRSNVEGTKTILRAAHAAGVQRIVYTSSVAAIGLAEGSQLADETTTVTVDELIGDYKKSKFLAEEVAREAARAGVPVTIVNPSTPIGPRDVKPTPTGDIILRFLRRQMPFFVHTGLNLVHVRDVVMGHILAAEKGKIGERYILGHQNVTLKEMLDRLERITGLPAPKRALPHWLPIAVGYIDELVISRLLDRTPTVAVDSAKMARHPMYYSSRKAVEELGLPQTPIEEALEEAVNWFHQNGYVAL